MMTTKRFAMRLKRLRAQRKISQADLSKTSGVSREYIARLELGQQEPTLGTLEKLAKALKVKVGRLLE
jgi:transcriptional regulator with XRE-family HTH domain